MNETSSPPSGDAVAAIYDRYASYQWSRLDAFPCELHIHLTALHDHLPAGSRILDLGAGPGRYAIALAAAGHRVVAGDLSPVQVELARRHAGEAGFPPGGEPGPAGGAIEAVLELDARELGAFPAASFDAVVAFGPFYHLKEEAERRRAAAAAVRVLRPGGLIFASFMPRAFWLGLALQTFVRGPESSLAQLASLERFYRDGRFTGLRSPQLRESYFCQVDEIAPLWREAGVRQRRLLASNGVVAGWSRPETWNAFADRPAELRRRLLDLVYATAGDPHLLAMSDQILFIGEKGS